MGKHDHDDDDLPQWMVIVISCVASILVSTAIFLTIWCCSRRSSKTNTDTVMQLEEAGAAQREPDSDVPHENDPQDQTRAAMNNHGSSPAINNNVNDAPLAMAPNPMWEPARSTKG